MNFTTKVPVTQYESPIDYNSSSVSIGSCFADTMGAKFDYFRFRNTVNPFGVIFNPVSIEKIAERIVNRRLFTEKDIFCHNDLWHCYEVHSELSHPDKETFLKSLNAVLESTNSQITESTHILITYGTSWIYRNLDSNEIVANCHKVPQKEFIKEILSVETIGQSIQNTIALIQKINPGCQFIFTISPVRHIKDGFAENQRSKAHLITALHHVIANLPSANYFPSYEIMMDELRDYRFYADDMLHPSQSAIDYIWERFSEKYVSNACFIAMQEVDSIQKGLAHRPFNPDTASHKKFLEGINQKIIKLQEQFSHIRF